MKVTTNKGQTKIFRGMSVDKKIKLVCDFHRFALKLQKQANPTVYIEIDGNVHYKKSGKN